MIQPDLISVLAVKRAIRSLHAQYNEARESGKCFECNFSGNCHLHHVVPRSRGGTKMVILCESCHGKVHDRSFENHTNLIRMGLANARRKGVTLGRPEGSKVDVGEYLKKHDDIVRLLGKGYSIRNVATLTDKSKGTVEAVKRGMGKA